MALYEEHEPLRDPVLRLGPPMPWHPDRVRMWLAISAMILFGLAVAAYFTLILTNASAAALGLWGGIVTTTSTLTAAVVAYYFAKDSRSTGVVASPDVAPVRAAARTEPAAPRPVTVAVLGSFRRSLADIAQAVRLFEAAGYLVSTPAISPIVNPAAEFVRFEDDPPEMTDEALQRRTLDRIRSSDLVYVVAPGSYIGRTTSYEIGYVRACDMRMYFSEPVSDLPIAIGDGDVCSAEELIERLRAGMD
jgi:hypothetical protein